MLDQTHNFDPRRAVILEAADIIEKYPERFRFNLYTVPTQCGSPGCALGLIGYCAGLTLQDAPQPRTLHARQDFPSLLIASDVASWLGVSEDEFYCRMNNLVSLDWTYRPAICALSLRRYADAYHPARLLA